MIPTETLHSITHITRPWIKRKLARLAFVGGASSAPKKISRARKMKAKTKTCIAKRRQQFTYCSSVLTSAPPSRLHDNGNADWNALRMMCDQAICYQTLILYHIKKNGF